MSKYHSAIEDSSGRVHATLSIIHIDPACGHKIYIGTGREPHEVDCPDCLRLMAEAEAASALAAAHEQDYGVWRFDTSGDQYWVAARSAGEALGYFLKQPCGRGVVGEAVEVTDLDEYNMAHGDPHEGEEVEPCSLRELLRWKLQAGYSVPVIIAASDWMD